MSDNREQISAWLDDAADASEVVSLTEDSGATGYSTAARYQMIGDALRGQVSDAAMIDVSAAVREAIAQEPAFEAQAKTRARPAVTSQPERSFFDAITGWLKPVGGLAVAATVAMVMVVTLTEQPITGDASIANVGQQPVNSLPVSNAPASYGDTQVAVPAVNAPAVNFNSYVTESSDPAVPGNAPYSRAITYEAEEIKPEQEQAQVNPAAQDPNQQ